MSDATDFAARTGLLRGKYSDFENWSSTPYEGRSLRPTPRREVFLAVLSPSRCISACLL